MNGSRSDEGRCHACERSFRYRLVHNGFNESWYAYCKDCGRLGTVSFWGLDPTPRTPLVHGPIPKAFVHVLPDCPCGGSFSPTAEPRCPHCLSPLDPVEAAEWIEANAPATEAGWQWQRRWDGLYSVETADSAGEHRGVSV